MKVVVCFATGYEEVEALATVDVLRRAGIEVVMTGVDGAVVSSGRNIKIHMDELIERVKWPEIDMIMLPGGLPGVDNLIANEVLCENLKDFKEKGKWIGAICAAPSMLGKLGLLKGERATCYPGFEETLEGAVVTHERVTVSHKIVTGIGAGASLEFAFAVLEVLKGNEVAQKLKKAMMI